MIPCNRSKTRGGVGRKEGVLVGGRDLVRGSSDAYGARARVKLGAYVHSEMRWTRDMIRTIASQPRQGDRHNFAYRDLGFVVVVTPTYWDKMITSRGRGGGGVV